MTASADTALVAALQAALAGEHAAVWACGRAAAVLAGDARDRALGQLDDHRRQRDALRVRLVALGADPVEAATAYVEPVPVVGRGTARALLAHVGAGLCAVYADLAAASAQGARQEAVSAAARSARRAVGWGADAQAFPGSADSAQALPTERDEA